MVIGNLLTDPGALATLIGVVLAAILSLITTILVQARGERRQQLQITYTRRIETPSILAESEINRNLHISYQGKDVSDLRFFSVDIVNSGKRLIDDFQFLCEFDSNVEAIDPKFPDIFIEAPIAVQPDQPLLDAANSTSNKFQYIIKSFAVGQKVTANFLFAKSKNDKFEVRFIHPQYEIHEGSATTFSTIERNIISVIQNFLIFYIITQISPLIAIGISLLGGLLVAVVVSIFSLNLGQGPQSTLLLGIASAFSGVLSSLGDLVGVIVGIPFLLRAYRSARPLIPLAARKLQEKL